MPQVNSDGGLVDFAEADAPGSQPRIGAGLLEPQPHHPDAAEEVQERNGSVDGPRPVSALHVPITRLWAA